MTAIAKAHAPERKGSLAHPCTASETRGRYQADLNNVNTLLHKHFRLRTLGGLQLDSPSGAVDRELATRRRKLALLAYLAIVDKPVARATLIELFWGDQPEDRARHSLSDTLSSLRRVLGSAAISARLADVQLDSVGAGLSTDARELARAAADGRHADVIALYEGPFLPAFAIPGSQRFDEWIEQERLRLSKLFSRSCRALCLEAEGRNDWVASLALGLRWLEADPLSTGAQLAVLKGHAGDGNPDSLKTALHVFRQLEQRLSRDYGALPDRDARELVEFWQARLNDAGDDTSGSSSSTIAPAAVVAPPSSSVSRTRRRTFAVGGLALAAAVGMAVVVRVAFFSGKPAVLREGEFVLLSEFVNHTSDSMLTRSVGAAVAAALQQSAYVVPLPRSRVASALVRMQRRDTAERLDVNVAREVAQREGVRLVLAGEIVQAGPARQLISRIIEARSGDVLAVRTFRVTSGSSLFLAIDSLAAGMRRDLGEASAAVAQAIPLPAVTTTSLPALKYFADGVRASRNLDDAAAADLFVRAVAVDSNFAAAHARLGSFYALNNDVRKSAYHFGRALAQAPRLPIEEALRMQVSAAWARGDHDSAVMLSRQYLALRSRDADAWDNLGYHLFSARRMPESRTAYAVSDSISPLSAVSLMNVGTSYYGDAQATSSRAAFDSARHYYERAIKLQPSIEFHVFYNDQYGMVLLGAGLMDSARATYDRMGKRSPSDRARALRSHAYLDATEGKWRSASERLALASALSAEGKNWTSALRNDALQADLLLALGEGALAAAPLRRATTIAMREPIEARALAFIAQAQVRAGNRVAAARLLARMRAVARGVNAEEKAAILTIKGAELLAAGRVAEARTALSAALPHGNAVTQMLLARALAAEGNDSGALKLLDAISSQFSYGVEGQFDVQMIHYERALVLERLGRPNEAIAALRALTGRYPVRVGDTEPLALVDARQRLQRYDQGGR